MTPPSLLLIDAVLATLAEGETVSARKVSRTLGEDQTKILGLLKKLSRDGVLRSKTVQSPSHAQEKPYEVFTPVNGKVSELMKERARR